MIMTENLAYELVSLARTRRINLASAESCTGGLIGAAITSISGSSDVFGYGFITYSNDAKRRLLDVKEETLNKYGAVSKETAKEMALGGISVSGADLCVAVTGIAGPGGGSAEKPVGLVFVAIVDKKQNVSVKKLELRGDRNEIRLQSVTEALKFLIEAVEAY
jgi:PncC family amidohydrolase